MTALKPLPAAWSVALQGAMALRPYHRAEVLAQAVVLCRVMDLVSTPLAVAETADIIAQLGLKVSLEIVQEQEGAR